LALLGITSLAQGVIASQESAPPAKSLWTIAGLTARPQKLGCQLICRILKRIWLRAQEFKDLRPVLMMATLVGLLMSAPI
jgi:hypothetical protein